MLGLKRPAMRKCEPQFTGRSPRDYTVLYEKWGGGAASRGLSKRSGPAQLIRNSPKIIFQNFWCSKKISIVLMFLKKSIVLMMMHHGLVTPHRSRLDDDVSWSLNEWTEYICHEIFKEHIYICTTQQSKVRHRECRVTLYGITRQSVKKRGETTAKCHSECTKAGTLWHIWIARQHINKKLVTIWRG